MSNATPHRTAPHHTAPHRTSCTWLVCVFCRASIVNLALVGYFMEELAIQEHFVAMRRFLLLEDGEFGHALASALFEAVSSPSAVVRLSSAAFLNPLLTTALQSSIYGDTPHSSRLGFALKYQPAVVKANCKWVWLASSGVGCPTHQVPCSFSSPSCPCARLPGAALQRGVALQRGHHCGHHRQEQPDPPLPPTAQESLVGTTGCVCTPQEA